MYHRMAPQTDIAYYNANAYDYNWDAVWECQDHYWGQRLDGGDGDPFFQACVIPVIPPCGASILTGISGNKGEYTGWSQWPMAYDPSRIIYGGLLTDIHPPDPKVNIRLQPYGLVKNLIRRRPDRNDKTGVLEAS